MKNPFFNIVILFFTVSNTPTYASSIDEYINSEYVKKFNEEITDFIEGMSLLTDGKHYFVRSQNTVNYTKSNSKTLLYNLFYGDKDYLYQITTSGSYQRVEREKLLELSFKSNNSNLEGEVLFGILSVKCDGNFMSLIEVVNQEERDVFFSKVTFVPIFPERKELFYYRQDKDYVFIDTYRENIIGGEERVFIGTPGKMEKHKVKRVISYECDKNSIYILENGKAITPPEYENGILRPHSINGKILGIESEVNGVEGLTKPDIILPCPEETVMGEYLSKKLHEQQHISKPKNDYKGKVKLSTEEIPAQTFVQKSNKTPTRITPTCIPRPITGRKDIKEEQKEIVSSPALKMSVGYSSRPHMSCNDKDN